MENSTSGYRLTTYNHAPWIGTHYSVDKLINSEWCVVKLFYDMQDAIEWLNKAIDSRD